MRLTSQKTLRAGTLFLLEDNTKRDPIFRYYEDNFDENRPGKLIRLEFDSLFNKLLPLDSVAKKTLVHKKLKEG